jgi:hypothetical protein
MKTLFAIIFLFSSLARAGKCENDLLGVIGRAKEIVKEKVDYPNCRTAAMEGNQNSPGCNIPHSINLLNIMLPIGNEAAGICNSTCNAEGKKKNCKAIVNKPNLRKIGLLGAENKIRNGIAADASFIIEEVTAPWAPTEI